MFEVCEATHPALRGGKPAAFRVRDGQVLRGEWLFPEGKPVAVVALSHAMMVDRRTLDRPPGEGLLSALVAAQLQVFWFDQRGHGQSGPCAADHAEWDYDTLVEDAGAVAAYVQAMVPDLPVIAVGHSLFAHVALAWQAVSTGEAPRFDGLVLLAGNVWLRALEPSGARFWLKRLSFLGLLALTRWHGYFPAVRLSVGSADEPLPYLLQMGSWLSSGDYTDRNGGSYRQKLGRVQVPILSVAGAGDHLMAVPSCQLRFVLETAGSVTHWTIGRRFCAAIDPDHMSLVMSQALSPVYRDVAAWIATPNRFAKTGQTPPHQTPAHQTPAHQTPTGVLS